MKPLELTVSRTIDATAEEVFDAWIDPAKFRAWLGAQRLITDPVVDGLFYVDLGHEGRVYHHYGRFLRIERPRLIEKTWVSEGTRGLESVVSLGFEARGDRTELTIRHTGLPDDEGGRNHQEGWSSALEQLATHLAARR